MARRIGNLKHGDEKRMVHSDKSPVHVHGATIRESMNIRLAIAGARTMMMLFRMIPLTIS